MIFKGYKITFSYRDWQQVERIGDFWDYCAQFVPRDQLVGLGWNWQDAAETFDYALGSINNPATVEILNGVDFANLGLQPEYIEVALPAESEWRTFSGHVDDLQKIYEEQIDPLGEKDYELEFINDAGDYRVMIHFVR